MKKDIENKSMEPAAENTGDADAQFLDDLAAIEESENNATVELPRRFGDGGGLSFGGSTFGQDVPRSEWDSEQK